MPEVDSRSLPVESLNRQRRLAVRLRLEGQRLKDVTASTGLSSPTIIAAHKAYIEGGWDAVELKRRGRSLGDGRSLTPEQERETIRLLQQRPLTDFKHLNSAWSTDLVVGLIAQRFARKLSQRTVKHYQHRWQLIFSKPNLQSGARKRWRQSSYAGIAQRAGACGAVLLWLGDQRWQHADLPEGMRLLYALDNRGRAQWLPYQGSLRAETLIEFLQALCHQRQVVLLVNGLRLERVPDVQNWIASHAGAVSLFEIPNTDAQAEPAGTAASRGSPAPVAPTQGGTDMTADGRSNNQSRGEPMSLTHLQRLEAESIHIMREVMAEADNPVMLYSIGKDSAVMLHLALKAFFPAKPPFPMLHVDTTWKFREMYEFRDRMARELGIDLIVHVNPDGLRMNINPFTHGSAIHTDIMKTQGLKQALEKYGFDAAFGGARRDEEKSRAKERIFSFRSAQHRWDPKSQRPELWHIYNARKLKGESIRVFPLSNWTELDIWQYIHLEQVPIVPLYFAKERPVVERDGVLIMVDDDRMPLKPGEVPMMRSVRFRTLGCYPLTGAIESAATTLPAIIQEMLLTKTSERQGRVIDHDQAASMEKKKQEGYF